MSPLVPDRLATGRIVDLADPPLKFDWLDEIARPLGRIARFAGQAADRDGAPYSVGEHSVRGARAIVEETHDDGAGLAFLIHDAHEVLGGDVKRPFMDLAELIAARDGIAPGGEVRRVIEAAKSHLDRAIHAAAGIPWPLPSHVALIVRDMDERMAAEEMRRFWPALALPEAYRRLRGVPWSPGPNEACWPVELAAALWMEELCSLHAMVSTKSAMEARS